jgi:hypothetical protein
VTREQLPRLSVTVTLVTVALSEEVGFAPSMRTLVSTGGAPTEAFGTGPFRLTRKSDGLERPYGWLLEHD